MTVDIYYSSVTAIGSDRPSRPSFRSSLSFVATPVDTGSERLTDRALAITDDLLGSTARLVQRLHRTVHERRVLHDARRGVLGEPRDGDYIRNYADKLRQS